MSKYVTIPDVECQGSRAVSTAIMYPALLTWHNCEFPTLTCCIHVWSSRMSIFKAVAHNAINHMEIVCSCRILPLHGLVLLKDGSNIKHPYATLLRKEDPGGFAAEVHLEHRPLPTVAPAADSHIPRYMESRITLQCAPPQRGPLRHGELAAMRSVHRRHQAVLHILQCRRARVEEALALGGLPAGPVGGAECRAAVAGCGRPTVRILQ